MSLTYGSDDTGAVRANHAGLVLRLEHVGDADHVYSCQSASLPKLPKPCIPCCGIPSVILSNVSFHVRRVHMHTYVTIRGISAAIASSILAAATDGLSFCQITQSVES
jgi:hypothetical protein